jgi:transposase
MKGTTVGIDLAKNVFHLCVMNSSGRVIKRARSTRSQLYWQVLNLNPDTVAMECCGGSHYWARRFESAGLKTRQISPQFVKPYVKSNKNDYIDAEAICEAASREEMRFVATRSEYQQDIQHLHRIRERLVKQRTALVNEIRGFMHEYGFVIPKGISKVKRNLLLILEKESNNHSPLWRETFLSLYEEFVELEKRILHYELRLKQTSQSNEICVRLMKIPGVGYLTATAMLGAIGNIREFKNGRQFSAYLGLVPRQHSTGGKSKLLGISKRGDRYLRKLLVQGANSLALSYAKKRANLPQELSYNAGWHLDLRSRKCHQVACVALANKIARQIFVVFSGEDYEEPKQLSALAA